MSKIRPPWGSSLDWWPPQPKKIEKKSEKNPKNIGVAPPEGPIFGLVGRKKKFFFGQIFFFSTCRKSGHPGAAAWTGGHPNQKKSKKKSEKNPKNIGVAPQRARFSV